MAERPQLGYWKIRGLAHSIRLLLKYKEVEFDDVMYEQGDEPSYSTEAWTKVKFTLGLDLPNLPYYIDGDLKITESIAILYHLGRKYDLLGTSEVEKVRNDMMMSAQSDSRMAGIRVFYGPNYDDNKEAFKNSIPQRLEKFANFLGERTMFAGENITVCDFLLWDLFDIWKAYSPGCLEKFDNLQAFMSRFEALPTIKSYLASPDYMQKPFNNKIAHWGGQA